MKRISYILKMCIVLLVILSLANSVSAIGIKWFTESEAISENSDACVTYGAYNPSEKDIKVKMEVTRELKEIITEGVTEDKIIKSGTSSRNAEMINFCFKVPKIYEEDCLISDFICDQKCEENLKTYKGEIVMTEAPVGNGASKASGSAITVAAAAPLSMKVSCKSHPRDWTLGYILAIVIVVLILTSLLYKRYRTPKIEREKKKLRKLKRKIEEEKKKRKR